MVEENLMKKLLVKITIAFSLLFSLSLSTPISAKDDEAYIDGQYVHLELQETDDPKVYSVFAKNRDGEVVEELLVEGDYIYHLVDDEKEVIAVKDVEEVEESLSTLAVEPTWGPLLSQTIRCQYPNPESSGLTALTAAIAACVFPNLSLPIAIAQAVAEYIMAYHPNYVNTTAYFNEASGCPQYRWYRRQIYRSSTGAVIHDYSLNNKTFIGVRNSPENPPACRAYGF